MFSLWDIFWIFFLAAALQPYIQRRLLEGQRQNLIAKIERKRMSRVILLVHRQETMGLLGFPVMRYINIEDSEEVIRAIHLTDKEVPLDLVLHTPGGLSLAALQIAWALKRHPAKVTVFVPHYAMSGGTLIALAADEIVMCEHAVLGPVDPQLGQFPAPSILRLLEKKPPDKVDDETLILADIAEKAVNQMREAVKWLLTDKFPPEKAEEIARMLTEGRWTHDHPITYEDAKSMGLPVSSGMPEEILQLMSLYKQPVRTTPAVEYLPIPHRAPGRAEGG
jgi:ClpP class serine protease